MSKPAAPVATDLGRDGRVRAVHAQARPTVALAAAFVGAASAAALLPHRTGTWLPLHLLVAGGVLLAISATTQLFTVTWSAAAAPPDRWVRWQRLLVVAGVAGLAAGRELAWPTPALALAGASLATSLAILGVLLESTRRSGSVRRFDIAVRHYEAAVCFGLAGCGLGLAMVVGGDGLRAAHLAANLLGLVGLVVLGTLPTFVATTARMRTSARLDSGATLPLRIGVGATAMLVIALAFNADVIAAAGLAGWVVALVLVVRVLPRPGMKQLRWAGPRLVGIGCAIAWIAAALAVSAELVVTGREPFPPPVLGALAVGGFGQLVWAALCYLVPVLRGGGHEVLGRSFAATRSPLGLLAVNVAAALLAAGRPVGAAFVGTLTVADTVVRFVKVAEVRSWRPRSPLRARSTSPVEAPSGDRAGQRGG